MSEDRVTEQEILSARAMVKGLGKALPICVDTVNILLASGDILERALATEKKAREEAEAEVARLKANHSDGCDIFGDYGPCNCDLKKLESKLRSATEALEKARDAAIKFKAAADVAWITTGTHPFSKQMQDDLDGIIGACATESPA